MSIKLREAVACLVSEIEHRNILDDLGMFKRDTLRGILNGVKNALAEPIRNCDVGTVREQEERFMEFCGHCNCKSCKLTIDGISGNCEIVWSQMPYEEVKK